MKNPILRVKKRLARIVAYGLILISSMLSTAVLGGAAVQSSTHLQQHRTHAADIRQPKDQQDIDSEDAKLYEQLLKIRAQIQQLKKDLEPPQTRDLESRERKEYTPGLSVTTRAHVINNVPHVVAVPKQSQSMISPEELNLGAVRTPENQHGSRVVVPNLDKGKIPVSVDSKSTLPFSQPENTTVHVSKYVPVHAHVLMLSKPLRWLLAGGFILAAVMVSLFSRRYFHLDTKKYSPTPKRKRIEKK